MSGSVARNDPCPCGSGLKYKQCCLKTGGVEKQKRLRLAQLLALVVAVAAVFVGYQWGARPAFVVLGVGALVVGGLFFFINPPPPRSGGNPGAINFGR